MTFAFLAWRLRASKKTDSSGEGNQESEVRANFAGADYDLARPSGERAQSSASSFVQNTPNNLGLDP
jgi:hypothetical protein